MNGTYIMLEGIVGTGKTTQSKKIYEYLKNRYPDREILLTREPGGSEIAEKIRKIVQGTKFEEEMDPVCEAYLYASSRAQTLRKVVLPVLDRGGIVISDRGFPSSLTYQGKARGLGIKRVMDINREAVSDIIPDLVLYIDLDPSIGLKRCFDHSGDKFENYDIGFFRKIREGYAELAQHSIFDGRWINIDGRGSKEEVFYKTLDEVMRILP